MDNFLDQEFFSNPIRDYLWIIGIILVVLLLKRYISKYIATLLCRIFKKAWKTFDEKKFIDLILHPLGIFLVVTVSIVALYRLNFPEDLNVNIYKYSLQRIFLSIASVIQIMVFIWLLMRIVDFIATILEIKANKTVYQGDNQLIIFFRDFLKVVIGIIGGVMVLHFAFRYKIGSLLTGLSIVGAAIALALRESLENLIASFVIFFDKPFTTGDNVKVMHITGTVERIGLRSTRIRSDQKTYVSVPNKQMVDSILDNISLRTQQRNELLLQISPETSSEKIEELMKELKEFLSKIKELELYNVFFVDINVQAYAIMVEFFLPAAYLSEFNRIKQELNLFALRTIEKLEIKIAGANKEVIMK